MLRAYYSTLKPERTYANVMTTLAGFLFACRWHIDWGLLTATVMGTTLIVASACAVNNCTDRTIDARMPRTRKRPLVTNMMPVRNVALLAVVLGAAGFGLLIAYVNWLTVLIGVIGYIDYVVFYSWSKRRNVYSTLIGTVSGAAPIVAGYTAVTARFDSTALLLALIMTFWQMSHFYAIGIFRRDDYKAASLPIWPVQRGVASTRRWILIYIVLYLAAVTALTVTGNAGYIYLILAGSAGLYWLAVGLKRMGSVEPTPWARSMFGLSLVALLVLSATLSVGSVLY
jgi:protoheme IX farnesyltransferase